MPSLREPEGCAAVSEALALSLGGPDVHEGSALLRALGHPVRLRVLALLREGPKCVARLNEFVEVSQPNLSQHLMTLRALGLVRCEVQGLKRCYSLADTDFVSALFDLLARVRRIDGSLADRLDDETPG